MWTAAFGWEHAVILTAEGSVSTCAVPALAIEDTANADSPATSVDTEQCSIPEPVTAIAAGEQHRCSATPFTLTACLPQGFDLYRSTMRLMLCTAVQFGGHN